MIWQHTCLGMLNNDKIIMTYFEEVLTYDVRRKIRNSRPSN